MSISVNGQSQVPPGFRFHPTEEELLHYYLRKKVCSQKIDLDVIKDVDLNKLEPWDIQEKCKIGTTPQNDWYFFSHKDKKYPTGTRTNRATASGFWKATGRDKVIYGHNSTRIGMRKTLVFYKGRAPHGLKSDWIMHEYRLEDNTTDDKKVHCNVAMGEQGTQEEGWVVCRVFKKKNHIPHKTLSSSSRSPPMNMMMMMMSSSYDNEGTLEEMLQVMGTRPYTAPSYTDQQDNDDYNMRRFMKLPSLQHQEGSTDEAGIGSILISSNYESAHDDHDMMDNIQDWAALDRLVASQVNAQKVDTSKHHHNINSNNESSADTTINTHDQLQRSSSTRLAHYANDTNVECDLWSFTRPSDDQLCHLPNLPV